MRIALPVTDNAEVGSSWGRASRVAIADIDDGVIVGWRDEPVEWDRQHDQGTDGAHHARVALFLRDNGIDRVVAQHMGAPMLNMLQRMGVVAILNIEGDARVAAEAAALA